MTEHESNEAMNELIRGPDKLAGASSESEEAPAEELLTSHEQLAVEGLRQGVAPSLAGDLWRLVGPAADLEPDAEIDAAAEVAEIERTWPHIFDDEETAFNRTLRGAGLAAYTASTPASSWPGSANGGAMPIPETPKTMSDRIRDTFHNRRSAGRGTGWEG